MNGSAAALVYVRQSTIGQLTHNRESRQRQYELAQHVRELGFRAVDVWSRGKARLP